MAHKLVTCPETAHLEGINFEQTTCGIVITGCTRFGPGGELRCGRDCAARLDRRARTTGALMPEDVQTKRTSLR